jgi:hypothetical protein
VTFFSDFFPTVSSDLKGASNSAIWIPLLNFEKNSGNFETNNASKKENSPFINMSFYFASIQVGIIKLLKSLHPGLHIG